MNRVLNVNLIQYKYQNSIGRKWILMSSRLKAHVSLPNLFIDTLSTAYVM